jgi:dihydroneopterin aldolase
MKATSMYIYLEGARFFAHHGVDPQETIVGANFIIDLRLRTDFTNKQNLFYFNMTEAF